MQCPACNGKRARQASPDVFGVYRCSRKGCQAVFGQCYKGDSYQFVLPYMATETVPHERLRFYDLTLLGSDGVHRSHGWYDPETRLVHQVG